MIGAPPRSSNFRKHTSGNPVQRALLARFHAQVGELVGEVFHIQAGCPRSQDVLEVGCGEGFVARALDLPTIGLDRRPEARPAVLADAARLPIRDKAVPIVLCLEVLEHLPEPWIALEEMRRVCSGHLILSVPDQPWFSLGNFLRGKNLSRFGEDPEHLWHWRGETFLRLLRERCEVVQTVRSFPWVIALAKA